MTSGETHASTPAPRPTSTRAISTPSRACSGGWRPTAPWAARCRNRHSRLVSRHVDFDTDVPAGVLGDGTVVEGDDNRATDRRSHSQPDAGRNGIGADPEPLREAVVDKAVAVRVRDSEPVG